MERSQARNLRRIRPRSVISVGQYLGLPRGCPTGFGGTFTHRDVGNHGQPGVDAEPGDVRRMVASQTKNLKQISANALAILLAYTASPPLVPMQPPRRGLADVPGRVNPASGNQQLVTRLWMMHVG